jgi:NADH-quinone oxidoreductase subunit J
MGEQIMFYILAVIIVAFSLLAVTTKKIIRSATYLLFVLISTAGIYLLLDYHFLAMVQIAVYAGGIMVLFIFSILLTHNPGDSVKPEKTSRIISAGLLSLAGLAIAGHIIYNNIQKAFSFVEFEYIDMTKIGMLMMGTGKHEYLLPFEAISLLLLACIIGGIMIARRR